MRVFNLAEELEKERKKNKELEERIKIATDYINDIKNYMSIIGDATGCYEYTIGTRYKEELLDILKGDNK